MAKRVKAVSKKCNGRYGGLLPATVKGLAKAYIADYDRRNRIIERGDERGRDEVRFRKINHIIDQVIISVLDMHGIFGQSAEMIAADIKSGRGGRNALSVVGGSCFLSRYLFEQVYDDVLWFVARELYLI